MTQTQIDTTTWLGQPALMVETAALRLITVPTMGAKIVSLYDKAAEREWLLPPIDRPFQPVAYGAPFTGQDMSGWDEMFPTIDACAYPVPGPYQGNPLPDHGEVWALPWSHATTTPDALSLSVEGRALPYTLTRTIRAVDSQTFRLAFEVTNTGEDTIVGLWAAHPQFVVDAETRVLLPPDVREVVNVQNDADWGPVGTAYSWPEATNNHGRAVRLDQVGPASLKSNRKFYLPPDSPANWAALQQGADGAWLCLSWDTATVPYLGLWVDEGTYNAAPTAALEPSTGYYDSLTLAWQNGCAVSLPPGNSRRWRLDIACGSGRVGE